MVEYRYTMDIYYGYIMDILWMYYGYIMDVLWILIWIYMDIWMDIYIHNMDT